jgi:hypothetical protein
MLLFLYRCPKTGHRVQGFSADDVSKDTHIYEPVVCTVCKQIHHVNSATGTVLAVSDGSKPNPATSLTCGGRAVWQEADEHSGTVEPPCGLRAREAAADREAIGRCRLSVSLSGKRIIGARLYELAAGLDITHRGGNLLFRPNRPAGRPHRF